jgi:RNA polymerase sigma-70 factor (ECF subfamily)
MLGSLPSADEALRQVLVRGARSAGSFTGSWRSWLFTIATNRCLDMLRFARPHGLPAAASEAWLDPYPSCADEGSLALSFVASLHRVPPRQRAALLLRTVLGFSTTETASLLSCSAPAVHGLLRRARAVVAAPPAVVAADGPAEAYAAAWERGSVDEVVALLSDDARYSMPPLPETHSGVAAVRALLVRLLAFRWKLVPVRANGQPAFETYRWSSDRWLPGGLSVLTVRDGRVSEVVSFLTAEPHSCTRCSTR